MDEQFSLPGFDPEPAPSTAPPATDRLFFAVLPDAEAIAAIRQCTSQLQSQQRLRGRPIINGRLHISLLGLGDYVGIPVPLIESVSRAAAMVSFAAFDVHFDKALTFTHKNADPSKQKPSVLIESADSQGLTGLQHSLIASMQKVGIPIKAPSSFTPHVTLLYCKQNLEAAGVSPVAWKVREFVLVRSEIGDTSRPYDIVGRWPLSNLTGG